MRFDWSFQLFAQKMTNVLLLFIALYSHLLFTDINYCMHRTFFCSHMKLVIYDSYVEGTMYTSTVDRRCA